MTRKPNVPVRTTEIKEVSVGMRLTFKRSPRGKGLDSIANPYPYVTIKGNGKPVGWISPPHFRGPMEWRIHLHVKRDKGFENITLKYRATSEDDARAFVTKYWGALQKHKLHQLEE